MPRRFSKPFVFLYLDDILIYSSDLQQHESHRLVVLLEGEKTAVLRECHNNPGTGNHNEIRTTRDRIVAGYYWLTIKDVKGCHRCQLNDPMKTVAPVLHSIKVLELDLIGPLPETSRGNNYVLTMTDLYTKWVVAEPLQSKTIVEVSSAIISKLYIFGLVRKIITDQGKEFVNQVKFHLFFLCYCCKLQSFEDIYLLNIQHAVSTGNPIASSFALKSSTKYTPYFLLFHRHPRLPEVMNACPMGDSFEVGNAEEEIENQLTEVKHINARVCNCQDGSRCNKPIILSCLWSIFLQHRVPYVIGNISSRGVATVMKGSTSQKVNVSRLRPYYRLKSEFIYMPHPQSSMH
uniref:Integrase catalytic domain-containing protein n=1 Tax=Kryptolebias marmoratus TaxID=37003 RepID=A0A3Q3B746_KRYMA